MKKTLSAISALALVAAPAALQAAPRAASPVSDAEELVQRYAALISALAQSEVVQGFCYTQLTDVEQEVNGLLTYDRRPKADLARIRQITTTKQRGARGTEREGTRPYES